MARYEVGNDEQGPRLADIGIAGEAHAVGRIQRLEQALAARDEELAEERQEHRATLALAANLREAAQALYEEIADYISINHLGPVYHNRSMQMMRDALAAYEAKQPQHVEPTVKAKERA